MTREKGMPGFKNALFKNALGGSGLAMTGGIMGLRIGMLAIKFLLSIFIIRYLGLEQMGLFGLMGGAIAVVPILMRTGLFAHISRKSATHTRLGLCSDLVHYGTGCMALYLIFLPVAVIAGIYYGHTALFVLIYAVIMAEHLAYDVFTLTNHLGHTFRANIFLAFQTLLWAIVFMGTAYAVPSLRSLEYLCAFWTAGTILPLFMTAISTRHWPWNDAFRQGLSPAWYRREFFLSWRMYASDLVSTLSLYVDRYLIGLFLSLEMVGVYTLFWQAVNAICNLVGAGVLQAYRPRLIAAYGRSDNAEFHRLFWQSASKSFFSAAFLGIGSILVMPYLIAYTDEPLAGTYLPLFSLLIAALLFRIGTDAAGYALYAAHQDDLVLNSGILKLLLSTLAGIFFLNWLGLYGVVPTMVLVGSGAIGYAAYEWKKRKFI